jgi:hypothetical protein
MDKQLSLKNDRRDIFTFSLLSSGTRIWYAVMLLCIIAAATLMYIERHRLPLLGIVLGCFSLFVLCYVDRWRFNCQEKTIEYRVGLIFFALHKQYSFSDIEKAETERFIKGLLKTEFIKCVLCLRTGEKKTIAIFPAHNKTLERHWEILTAVFAG